MGLERAPRPDWSAISRRRTSVRVGLLVTGCAAIALWAGPAGGATGATERISVSSTGAQADGPSAASLLIDISADGQVATFASRATDLVPGDTNAADDIFVRNLDTGVVELVSVSSGGAIADGDSEYPAISADGRYVVFASFATNLVAVDENGRNRDIYRHDRQTGATELVSQGIDGRQDEGNCFFPDVSGDGRYVLFTYEQPGTGEADDPRRREVFVRDTKMGTTQLVSVAMPGGPGNASSQQGTISANGRFAAFSSSASDLVAGDTNGLLDVFVRDLLIQKTERVDVSTSGAQSNGTGYAHYVSPGGRYVIFESEASNLVAGDSNDSDDVFLRDRLEGTTERMSLTPTGSEGDQSSYDGFASYDMRYIAFSSAATNLVPGDTNAQSDVFVRDRDTGAVERISVGSTGAQASDYTSSPWMDAFGRRAIFSSDAPDLVSGDTNGVRDVFLHDSGPQGPGFGDTAASRYRVAAQVLAGEGIIGGYETGGGLEFRPGNPLWRAQFAKMIIGTLGVAVSESLTSPFTDLGADDPASLYPHEYVAAAYANGITTGITATTFGPYQDITRAQVITMVVRTTKERRPGALVTPPPGWVGTLPGTDPTHGQNIRIAEYNLLLNGVDLSGWDVWGKANRGETAQLLSNLRELVRE